MLARVVRDDLYSITPRQVVILVNDFYLAFVGELQRHPGVYPDHDLRDSEFMEMVYSTPDEIDEAARAFDSESESGSENLSDWSF